MTQPHDPEQPGSGDINVGDVSGRAIAIGHGAQATYQEIVRPLPVNLSSLVRPLIEHYTAVFGGRDAELAGLDAFLADPQHPFSLLVAPTGLGKTALLVHWIARVQQQHPQWRIIFAPVSIRYQTASEQVALSLLAYSLAEIHDGLEQFRDYDQSPFSLRALITDYLRRPLPDGIRLLLVLDGIDEATGWQIGPLCAVAPQPGLKVVVAVRQRANMTRYDWCQQLGWNATSVAHLDLQRLERPAVAALLRQSDPAVAAYAADPEFVEQFFRVSEGDPLTCNLLMRALLGGNLTPYSLTRRPPGLEAFLRDWVEALRKRRQASGAIRELLALCAVAYGPLTSDDLQALAPKVFVNQTDIVDAVSDDEVARFIITVGEGQRTYVFSHQRLREVFLEQIYPPKDREILQQRLITYGNEWYANNNRPLPDYLRQFWVVHLTEAKEWVTLRRVLTEIVPVRVSQNDYRQPWASLRFAAEGSYSGYRHDLSLLLDYAMANRDVALVIRCVLIHSSLKEPELPGLLAGIVMVGLPKSKWPTKKAIEHIERLQDEVYRTEKNSYLLEQQEQELVTALLNIADSEPGYLQDIVRCFQKLKTSDNRRSALENIIPMLKVVRSFNAWTETLQFLLQMSESYYRDQGYENLWAMAIEVIPTEVVPAALELIKQFDRSGRRATIIALLAPKITPSYLTLTLEAIDSSEYEWEYEWDDNKTLALEKIAAYVWQNQPVEDCKQALYQLLETPRSNWKNRVLMALTATLPNVLYPEALNLIEQYSEEEWFYPVLLTLITTLPVQVLEQVVRIALALSIPYDEHAEIWLALVNRMREQPDIDNWASLVDMLITWHDPQRSAEALGWLAPVLTERRHSDIGDFLRHVIAATPDARSRARILTPLSLQAFSKVPGSPETSALRTRAFEATHTLGQMINQGLQNEVAELSRELAWHFIVLSATFTGEMQQEIYTYALSTIKSATRNGADEEAIGSLMARIVHGLTGERLLQAYDVLVDLRSSTAVDLLPAVLSRMNPGQQRVVFTKAKDLQYADLLSCFLVPEACVTPDIVYQTLIIFCDRENDWWNWQRRRSEAFSAASLARLSQWLRSKDDEGAFTSAVTAAQNISAESRRAEALTLLAQVAPSNHCEHVCVLAIEAIRALESEWTQKDILLRLIPAFTSPALSQAASARLVAEVVIYVARSREKSEIFAALNTAIEQIRGTEEYAQYFQEILSSLDEGHRISVIGSVVPYVPLLSVERILLTACAPIKWLDRPARRYDEEADDEDEPVEYSDGQHWRLVEREGDHARILAKLAEHLPEFQIPDLAEQLMRIANVIADPELRTETTLYLISNLPATHTERGTYLEYALLAARACQDLPRRVKLVMQVATMGGTSYQQQLALEEYSTLTQNPLFQTEHINTLMTLVPHLPQHKQREAWRTFFERVRTTADDGELSRLVIAVAPIASEATRRDLLAIAETIINEQQRVAAICSLLPGFTDDIVVEVLGMASIVNEEQWRAALLECLSNQIAVAHVSLLIAALKSIKDEQYRMPVLIKLVKSLSTKLEVASENKQEKALDIEYLHHMRQYLVKRVSVTLPEEIPHAALFQKLWQEAHDLANERLRAQVLITLIPVVHWRIVPYLYYSACQCIDAEARGSFIIELALSSRVYLRTRSELLSEALASLALIDPESYRAEVVCSVLEQIRGYGIPESWISRVFDEKFVKRTRDICDGFGDLSHRTRVDISCAVLTGEIYPNILEGLDYLASDEERALAINRIAPYVRNSYPYGNVVQTLLQKISTIQDHNWRAEAYIGSGPYIFKPDSVNLHVELLDGIAMLEDQHQARVIVALTKTIPHKMLARAQHLAGALKDPLLRTRARAELGQRLLPVEQLQIYKELLIAVEAVEDLDQRAELLVQLFPLLPAGLLEHALKLLEAIAKEAMYYPAVHALSSRVANPYLPSDLFAQIVQAVRRFRESRNSIYVICHTVVFLPSAFRAELFKVAIEIGDLQARAVSLAAVAQHLEAPLSGEAFEACLQAIAEIYDESDRARLLHELAPQFPLEVIAQAVAVANHIADPKIRGQTLTRLAEQVPLTDRPEMYEKALAASLAVMDAAEQCMALIALTTHRSADQQLAISNHIVSTAGGITKRWLRDDVFQAISLCLCAKRDSKQCDQAVATSRQIESEDARRITLRAIAVHLASGTGPGAGDQVMNVIRELGSPESQYDFLITMASIANNSLRRQIQEYVNTIEDVPLREDLSMRLNPLDLRHARHLSEAPKKQRKSLRQWLSQAVRGGLRSVRTGMMLMRNQPLILEEPVVLEEEEELPLSAETQREVAKIITMAVLKIDQVWWRRFALNYLVPEMLGMRHEGPTENIFIGACSAVDERRSYGYANDYNFGPSLITIITAFVPYLQSNGLLEKAEEFINSIRQADVREQVLNSLEPQVMPEVDLEAITKNLKDVMKQVALRGSGESWDYLILERIATTMSDYLRREPKRREELLDLWQKQLNSVTVPGRPTILAILAATATWSQAIGVTDSVVDSVIEVAQAWP
jgi:hypothetical protein